MVYRIYIQAVPYAIAGKSMYKYQYLSTQCLIQALRFTELT
ncbi:MAG: hypothetical protein R2778_19305 [Saprospiraceae bacterium]